MRISTSQMFDVSTDSLSRQQSDLFRLQQQMSASKRILTPSDDPVAASLALTEKQGEAVNTQLQRNIGNARHQIGLAENALSNATNVMQASRQLLVQAGNTTLSDSDRGAIATELTQQLKQLLALANSDDGNGRYLFSGYQGAAASYVQTAAGASYQGDTGQPLLQVSANRYMEVSNTGNEIFELAPTGNGTFATSISDPAGSPAVVNTGTGLIDVGSLLTSGYTGQTYILKFNAGGTSYDVIQRTAGVETTLSSSNAYTSGAAISLGGGSIQVSVSGAPASGDRFVIGPSTNQNIFTTLQNAINLLNTPATSAVLRTQLVEGVRQAIGNTDQSMNQVSGVQTSMGARLRELDTLEGVNSAVKLAHTQRVSELEDLDYTQAVSDLARQQLAMTAAQNSFVKISKLSLFDYL